MGYTVFDKNDFEVKYNKYSKMIFRTAYQYLLNFEAAEDIVQEVFEKLFINKKQFEDENHEKAWLLRVTINKCKNQLSSKSSQNSEFKDERIVADVFIEEDSERRIDIEKELCKLTGQQRTCIYLFYFEQYKIKEISEMLKINENTIKSNLKRAREILKDNLSEEDDYELQ